MKKLTSLLTILFLLILPLSAFSATSSNKKVVTTKKSTTSRSISTQRQGNWSKIKDIFM